MSASAAFSQQERALEEQATIDEDVVLRSLGHPQSHIYMFRSADILFDTIRHLPVPWYDQYGDVPDSYWQLLEELGIATAALPRRYSGRSQPYTGTQMELRTFAAQASQALARAPIGNASPGTGGGIPLSFASRFGATPVRRINFGIPPSPQPASTPTSGTRSVPSSPSTGQLLSIAQRAVLHTQSSLGTQNSSIFTITPPGTQPPPVAAASETAFCDHIDFALPQATWSRVRSQLLTSNTCLVLNVFATTDKQFQSALQACKLPESLVPVGLRSFSSDAWRDMKEYFEALDVWNFFCGVVASNVRVILDSNESISLGGTEITRMLKLVPSFPFLGHSELTTGIAQWHEMHVVESPTLLFASLSSVVLRDRALRPLILQKVNAEAKAHIRSTFIRNDGLFITYIAALHSWRYKDDDAWTKLFDLNKLLAAKKPEGLPVRDWRNRLDRWRVERRTLGHADIDSDNEHIWMMRVLESMSEQPWYKKFRKDMARDERRGVYIMDVEEMWAKLEFEETWVGDDDTSSRRSSVHAIESGDLSAKRSRHDNAHRENRFDRDADVAAVGKGRGRGYDRGRNDARDSRRPSAPTGPRDRLRNDVVDSRRPGARKWASIGLAEDHRDAKPNDSSWSCRVCNQNPCVGFCEVCLMTCGHKATYANPDACPYYNGERVVRVWDYSRQCIKCHTPRADHQPWKCPSKKVVRIVNRQHPPRLMVDYSYRSRNAPRSVSVVSTDTSDYQHRGYNDPDFAHSDEDEEHAACDAVCNNLSAFLEEHPEPEDCTQQHDSTVNHVHHDTPRPHAQSESAAEPTSPAIMHISTATGLQDSIRDAVDEFYNSRKGFSINTTYIVNFVDHKQRPVGAMLLDSGAQINIENDIACFVGYIEKSDVKIGLADKKVSLRNCGVGTRERRLRDTDGNIYVYRDTAYYCPDAAYPIMSTGEWEKRDATVILNPGKRFRRTASGRALPEDGKMAVIVDCSERMLVLRQVEGCPSLHWVMPIEATSVEDIEQNRITSRNKQFVASVQELQSRLDEQADGPTVSDYSTKIKSIERDLEAAHLMHSQIFGLSQEANKQLIAAAYEAVAAAQQPSRDDRSAYSNLDSKVWSHDLTNVSTEVVCSRCRQPGHKLDTCIFPCNMCHADTGHEASCPAATGILPSQVEQLAERHMPHVHKTQHNGVTPHTAPDSMPITPHDVPPMQLAQSCASLQVVQESVAQYLEHHPTTPVSDVVEKVILTLAMQIPEHMDLLVDMTGNIACLLQDVRTDAMQDDNMEQACRSIITSDSSSEDAASVAAASVATSR
ncbi:MAG: hypothetical protein CMH41_03595, partial [Micrococcales bacterium]|nr:hypothetical protein [Micrococcales bacterium]